MTLYQIYSAVDNEEAYVDLKQDDRKIVEFINYNKGNYTDEAVFIAQSGYTCLLYTSPSPRDRG